MSYQINTSNYFECNIFKTDEEPDGVGIFRTFSEAKREYIKSLKIQKSMWNREIKRAYSIRKSEV